MAKFLLQIFFVLVSLKCFKLEDVGSGLSNGDHLYISSQSDEFPQENEDGVHHGSTIKSRNYLVVSTLDGRVTALDPRNGGQAVWSLHTGPGELLSSSLTNIKIPIHGQWATLVPSLDGQLYKFDGKSVEPLPVSAESLLKSSYKIADNLVIIGGKETRSYGVNIQTGELKYTCSLDGCDRFADVSKTEDILVIERQTQTVRAVHSRTGVDQWNFSVGEHRLTMSKGMKHRFPADSESKANYIVGTEDILLSCDENCGDMPGSSLKVVIPDGLIAATDRDSKHFAWSQQFPSPIVNVWKLQKESVWILDLFSQETLNNAVEEINIPLPSPLLVLGVHDKQLYIKESHKMKDQVVTVIAANTINSKIVLPQTKWLPYIATAPSRTPYLNSDHKPEEQNPTAVMLKDDFEYPYDKGFYLYDSEAVNMIENMSHCAANISQGEEVEETFEQIIIVSLWHWWKEVIVISLVTSILVNVIVYHFWNRIYSTTNSNNSESEIHIINPTVIPKSFEDLAESNTTEEHPVKCQDFVSRYLADFEPVVCLGKGGFGIVFEAKNKMDDCSYAIKRIQLNNKGDFEKVMREVKALAKLDHPGIVRYFNSWVESPPPGWQENKDKEWDDCSKASAAVLLSLPSLTVLQQMISPKLRNPLKPFDSFENDASFGFTVEKSSMESESPNFGKSSCLKKSLNSTGSDSFEVVFDKDSKNFGGPISSKDHCEVENAIKTFAKEGHRNETGDSSVFSGDLSADDSRSTEEEEFESSLSQEPFGEGKAGRPSVLSIPENNHTSDKMNTTKIYLFIQMQLCRKENLKDWLNFNTSDRDSFEVLDIFDQIVSAVDYVHDCGLMHRDLKPSNIFFSLDGTIKIGDFGLVTAVSDPLTPADCAVEENCKFPARHTDQVGTQLYMSPEQISRLPYNSKVDIFSLGLIFFELLVPFTTQSERIKTLLNVRKRNFPSDFREYKSIECELASRLLSQNPNERPSTSEIKAHNLFKAFQPQPVTSRAGRRRTVSQRMSSDSGSDCDINFPSENQNQLIVPT